MIKFNVTVLFPLENLHLLQELNKVENSQNTFMTSKVPWQISVTTKESFEKFNFFEDRRSLFKPPVLFYMNLFLKII